MPDDVSPRRANASQPAREMPDVVSPRRDNATQPARELPDAVVRRYANSTPTAADAADALRQHSGVNAMIPLNVLRYYQNSVHSSFSDGKGLDGTIQQLRDGLVTPESIRRMRVLVCTATGVVYAMTNRRLTCYDMVYGASDPKRLMPVRIQQAADLNPQGDGRTVRVYPGIRTPGGGVITTHTLLAAANAPFVPPSETLPLGLEPRPPQPAGVGSTPLRGVRTATSESVVQRFKSAVVTPSDQLDECRKQSGAKGFVPLHLLRYYQNTVNGSFSSGLSLARTIADLKSGKITPEDISRMRVLVCATTGVCYAMTNRRLTCYDMAYGATNPTRLMPVLLQTAGDLMPMGDGLTVAITPALVVSSHQVKWQHTLQAPEAAAAMMK
jgi:hypothetical protein